MDVVNLIEICDVVNFIEVINNKYKADCTQLKLEEPWGVHFTVKTDRKKSHNKENYHCYKIGKKEVLDLNIVTMHHRIAKGYYSSRPGELFSTKEVDPQDQLDNKTLYKDIEGYILVHHFVSS